MKITVTTPGCHSMKLPRSWWARLKRGERSIVHGLRYGIVGGLEHLSSLFGLIHLDRAAHVLVNWSANLDDHWGRTGWWREVHIDPDGVDGLDQPDGIEGLDQPDWELRDAMHWTPRRWDRTKDRLRRWWNAVLDEILDRPRRPGPLHPKRRDYDSDWTP